MWGFRKILPTGLFIYTCRLEHGWKSSWCRSCTVARSAKTAATLWCWLWTTGGLGELVATTPAHPQHPPTSSETHSSPWRSKSPESLSDEFRVPRVSKGTLDSVSMFFLQLLPFLCFLLTLFKQQLTFREMVNNQKQGALKSNKTQPLKVSKYVYLQKWQVLSYSLASLVTQWWRICLPMPGDAGSIPG